MYDVPSTAIFCAECIECSHGMGSKCFLTTCVTVPVAAAVSGMITNFVFHIRRVSVQTLQYFSLFSASFCVTLSAGSATLSVVLIRSVLCTVSSLSVCTA